MFSRFFIDRPIFASVLALVMVLAGWLTWRKLPLAQYPEITPPTVEVSASYPGANARVVADTVAAPIEQQVNGVEGMLYMSSQCTNDGSYTLTVTFKLGVDLNMAQVLVQNRVAMAQAILPDLVARKGVTIKKKSPTVLMIVNLYSPDGSLDNLYLSNYSTIQIRDELARLPGVGDITYLGQRDYSMRLWMDPERMSARNLTPGDVVRAIEQQNAQVAAGQIGQPPVPKGQVFQYTMTTLGRLADSDQFADMILKTDAQGRVVRMRDVCRVELGALGYDQVCTMDGQPSVALSIYQLPGSNALATAESVRAKMEELKAQFPEGLDYKVVYDTTPFITESIDEVYKTLLYAVLLVAFVMLLFLQNWRAAIIPLVAVPVAVVGTFAVMAAMRFSLNNLTLFGLVLAIGIVVDDAIVVVEAVQHHIERGLAPRDATIRAMEQVSGPVVAVGLVLSAVFIPCVFIGGMTGQFFRQFAVTIAASTLISAFNSLTLSPALSALLLRTREDEAKVRDVMPWPAYLLMGGWLGWEFLAPWIPRAAGQLPPALAPWAGEPHWIATIVGGILGVMLTRPANYVLAALFSGFNRGFNVATNLYAAAVGKLLRLSAVVLIVYGGLLWLTAESFQRTPAGFIPAQDKGYLLVNVQLPDAASLERTAQLMHAAEAAAVGTPGVSHTVAIAGQSLLLGANAPNFGSMYVMLDDFHNRVRERLDSAAVAERLAQRFADAGCDAQINIFDAPPIEGLGTAGGFKIMIEDRADSSPESLQAISETVVAQGNDSGTLQGLFTSFRANTPWIFLDIDRTQAKALGLSLTDVFGTLQACLGSYYVNDFNFSGRTWQVNVQADAQFRGRIEDIKQYKVRNERGAMVPLGTILRARPVSGPAMIVRYNMYRAAPINGSPAAGASSGEAIARMASLAGEATRRHQGIRPEWTELALLQLQTGNTAMQVFVLAVVLVFLVLAAQYESWSLPLAVILVVPMCLLFSVTGVVLAHMDINIFTQVGFVVLVGLACKNAILIVEYAKVQHGRGAGRHEATVAACRLRLRPIIMTSLAFIIGVVPLAISQGAGAEMRRTLGTAVFAGMLGVTLFGIFLTPTFYNVIQWIEDHRPRPNAAKTARNKRSEEGSPSDLAHD